MNTYKRMQEIEGGMLGRIDHVEKLLSALGNPSEWRHNGEVSDAGDKGKCACGHPIRWQFHIDHADGRRAVVGSTCIDHIAEISPALGDSLRATLARHREAVEELKRAAKAVAADEVNAALWAQYVAARDIIRARANAIKAARGWLNGELWHFVARSKFNRTSQPVYKTRAALKRWITDALGYLRWLAHDQGIAL